MIQHSGVLLQEWHETRCAIEEAFAAWVNQKYKMLSGTVDRKRPVLLSKTSDGGVYKGCMWFDLSSFSGRTVQSARIRLYRRAGVGKGNPVVVLIGTMSNTSPSGGVATVTAFTDIIGNVDQKEWLEASIPVAAAQQLANGTAKGIYTYGSATNYTQFDGYTDANPPQLVVTYN